MDRRRVGGRRSGGWIVSARTADGQRGAALIIALLMVATFAFIALSITERTARAARRSAQSVARGELYWRALSAETFAAAAIRQILQASEDDANANSNGGVRLSLENPLFAAPIQTPLPGGSAEIRFRDATRCFNVNSLLGGGANDDEDDGDADDDGQNNGADADGATVSDDDDSDRGGTPGAEGDQRNGVARRGFGQRDDETTAIDEAAVAELSSLGVALGFGEPDGERLAHVIADWIDPDTFQEIGGAEDSLYTALPTPFRTGGGPLASISEIRAMDGVNREIYLAFAPFLCARPEAAPSRINVNFLTPDDAPILVALTGGALTARDAAEIISDRPPGGWANTEDFWAAPQLQALQADENAQRNRTDVASSYIEVLARVSANDVDTGARLVFKTDARGPELISREYGAVD